MSVRCVTTNFLVAALLVVLCSCNPPAKNGPPAVASEIDDAMPDDATQALTVPYQPPECETPFVDRPFLQEYNHTSNEVEADIGELIDVIIVPESYGDFDLPTQIVPRGLVRHTDSGFEIIEIDPAASNLIAAAALAEPATGQDAILLAAPDELFLVADDGILTPVDVPGALTVSGVVAGEGVFFVLTDGGLGRLSTAANAEWPGSLAAVTAVLQTDSFLVVAGDGYLSGYERTTLPQDGSALWTIDDDAGLNSGKVIALVGAVTLPEELDFVVIGENGLQGLSVEQSGSSYNAAIVALPEFAADRVPLGDPREAVAASDGGFIVATAGGAYRIMERGSGPEWRVYNAERWLPHEDTRGVATDAGVADGPIWFATAGGLATVTAARITIEQKMESFVDRIEQRHDRYGAVADSHLEIKGDLSTNIPWDSDNDGSWTSYWLLAECFRYRVTGDPEARANFDKSLDAMLRLRDLTGTDYFFGRAAIHIPTCLTDDCDDPDDGEWFISPVDSDWWVKGDTSNDEIVAHAFMMGHAYDLCADDDQKERIAEHVAGIYGGIIEHGYQLLDIDGEVTTFGQYDPAYINDGLEGKLGDGGTRSVGILGELTLAYYLTGEQRFLDAKWELIDDYHYDENAITEADYPFRKGSGDGDEMGMMGWFVLLRYEQDPLLRQQWEEGWAKSWEHYSLQQGAWWDMVNMAVGGPEPDPAMTGRWLQLAPVDMIRWNQHNSHRHDLVPAPDYYEETGAMRSDGFIIPYDERRCDRWNTDQYRVDGGMGGVIEMDGADVLAPYWMGRYYGFIEAQE